MGGEWENSRKNIKNKKKLQNIEITNWKKKKVIPTLNT
jgi:hypothetical protein